MYPFKPIVIVLLEDEYDIIPGVLRRIKEPVCFGSVRVMGRKNCVGPKPANQHSSTQPCTRFNAFLISSLSPNQVILGGTDILPAQF